MEKILITGYRGFLGREVAGVLMENHDLYGTSRNYCGSEKNIFELDITNYNELLKCVEVTSPSIIIHLAALTKGSNQEMFKNNVVGFRNLLKTVCELKEKKQSYSPLVISANSCAIFDSGAALPLVETSPLSPASYYGLTKLMNLEDARHYSNRFGLKIISLIFFNLSGPNQSDDYVISSFCKQVAQIAAGLKKPVIQAGGLNNVRDFVDVRDAALAVEFVVNQSQNCNEGSEVFNICSGLPTRVSEVLNILLGVSGISFEVVEDISHQSSILDSFGDFNRFHSKFGWKPGISLEKSIEDNYHYWLQQLKE